ncbi:hypothetical protein GQ53DRAFT_655731 [Thozetella sp. PMI_491]|nr:hypothetical protein GQ53DRAFT_655731 [Thozetella sp. PMI_491]
MTIGWKLLPALSPIVGKSTTPEQSGAAKERPLGIVLHPERHVDREPQELFFQWNISQGLREPDGVQKLVYLVNNEFPGPTIEARSGDELVVEVWNHLDEESVSLHWHGLRLVGQNRFDGAVGFTQCPLPPGQTVTYRVKIGSDEHGTFWWHAHNLVQRGDGIFGGLVVHKPSEMTSLAARTEAERYAYNGEMLLMIGDWFHASARDSLNWYTDYKHFGNEPVPESLLVNGRGYYDCSLVVPARPVHCQASPATTLGGINTSGHRRARWRIVNTGSLAGFYLYLQGADMAVIKVDGGWDVNAGKAQGVGILYPGERVDVLVEWAETTAVLPRLFVSLDTENFKFTNPAMHANQSFDLVASASSHSSSIPDIPIYNSFQDLSNLTSSLDLTSTLSSVVSETIVLYAKTQLLAKFSNRPKGFLNHTSWAPQSPPLLSMPRSAWDENQLAPFIAATTSKPSWVELVINNLDDGSHPFHLHGHSFYILSTYRTPARQGWGSYNPFDGSAPPAPPNMASPLRKDTVSVPRRGHVIIRFLADSPGIWMLHCHMLVHLGSGMAMGLHVGPSEDESHTSSVDPAAQKFCQT